MNDRAYRGGPVIYWMNRDQRSRDNWALLAAQEFAREHQVPLGVVFVFSRKETIPWQELSYAVEGLREVELALRKKQIPFFLLEAGDRPGQILSFIRRERVGACMTDFSPLSKDAADAICLAKKASIPVHQVDAHNIVPCWLASDHQEADIRTFRKKIEKFLPEFLTKIPGLEIHAKQWVSRREPPDWKTFDRRLRVDRSAKPSERAHPGERAAMVVLRLLLKGGKKGDGSLRPYLQHGQLATQRVGIEAKFFERSAARGKALLDAAAVRESFEDNVRFYGQKCR